MYIYLYIYPVYIRIYIYILNIYMYIYVYVYTYASTHIYMYHIYIYIILNNVQVSFETWELDKKIQTAWMEMIWNSRTPGCTLLLQARACRTCSVEVCTLNGDAVHHRIATTIIFDSYRGWWLQFSITFVSVFFFSTWDEDNNWHIYIYIYVFVVWLKPPIGGLPAKSTARGDLAGERQ